MEGSQVGDDRPKEKLEGLEKKYWGCGIYRGRNFVVVFAKWNSGC